MSEKSYTLTITAEEALKAGLIEKLGLRDYSYLIDYCEKYYGKENAELNDEFRKVYQRFYRVRRNQAWQDAYFDIFCKVLKQEVDLKFPVIFDALLQGTKRMEPSFASKMLATVNPEMPIWDSRVLRALGIEKKEYWPSAGEKEDWILNTYQRITDLYKAYLGTDEAKRNCDYFRQCFPEYSKVQNEKIIDYYLWLSGGLGNQTKEALS